MFNLNPIKMKTQKSIYDYGHGIDVRDFPMFAKVLSEIFCKLSDEERVAYATLHLCDVLEHTELVRYDHDLCSICVGPLQLDQYMEDAQCAKFFVHLLTERDDFVNNFREFLNTQIHARVSIDTIRAHMLRMAKDVLESRMIEGFC